ncbi:MAG: flavodoxin family protein [Oscillospiraceae bacterium]|jgi:multimeric flavodoxin WrbA|nr:flavodoxin family protein [Oscillospiraceae bacterium]
MKTLIFNGSPRGNGGTAALINALRVRLSGDVTIVNTYGADISPCTDCRFCWANEGCAVNDGMQNVYRYICESDNILIASPIYFAELTGSLLSVMSRLQYLYTARRFRGIEVLPAKKRNGAIILVDGGDNYEKTAMAMGKRLLRIMNADFIGSVYFSGTDNEPKYSTNVPEIITDEIAKLAAKINRLNAAAGSPQRNVRR